MQSNHTEMKTKTSIYDFIMKIKKKTNELTIRTFMNRSKLLCLSLKISFINYTTF